MRKTQVLLGIIFALRVFVPLASAHCPLCTAAVGAGVALSRFYGVDDSIVGVWIGSFVVSTALWFNRLLKKKYVALQKFWLIILALLVTIIPLYSAGMIGQRYSTLLGIDALMFGILAGGFVTAFGVSISERIKMQKNKVLFPFQTIIILLVLLTLTTVVFWSIH